MKVYEYKDRKAYFAQQIERNRIKSAYCKVYFGDVIRYRKLLTLDNKLGKDSFAPILCLGVRTGAEVDLFRSVFLGPLLRFESIQKLAIRRDKSNMGQDKIRLARYFGAGGGRITDGKAVGVELTPEPQRPDVWTGSFDELPAEWSGKFRVLYSNSFDHSQDPERTVAEWKRVAAPGAYLILAFAEDRAATFHDPLGGIGFAEMIDWWKAPVVFTSETYNTVGYKEICFRL